jgi:S1-C subfamily serine protease
MLNDEGKVVGVAFMLQSTSSSNSGIGFGIPVYFVDRVSKAIIANGSYQHPWLGVRGTSISPFEARQLDLPVETGVLVAEALADGPAVKAGIRGGDKTVNVEGVDFTVGGDIITAVDGQPVKVFDDLLAYLSRYGEPGTKVTLTVLRDGEMMDIEVTLEVRPAAPGQ